LCGNRVAFAFELAAEELHTSFHLAAVWGLWHLAEVTFKRLERFLVATQPVGSCSNVVEQHGSLAQLMRPPKVLERVFESSIVKGDPTRLEELSRLEIACLLSESHTRLDISTDDGRTCNRRDIDETSRHASHGSESIKLVEAPCSALR
jgi:hypothetical protein